ncbi:MAG: valine--tRNA ligase [Candidatus Aenigmatarchaeota archaeon]
MVKPESKLKEARWSKDLEKPMYEEWKKKHLFRFNPKSGKRIFSIDTPPPYVNTPVHIGQTTTYVLMDMFARFHRMIGDEVLFPLGLDRNGLPIEMAVEKKFNTKLCNTNREEFLEKCKELLKQTSMESVESFLRCGIGFNSWNVGNGIGDVYLTDSPEYRSLTQDTFIDMWNAGMIYEDERVNNYCPGCRTTIADAEIEYEERPSTFNDIAFVVKETKERLIISTTRPELVCTCGMVIFHPDDERYKHLNGKTAITPLFNKGVPIKAHPMADPAKGTGVAMMCSAGDTSDIRFFREMKLDPVIAINADGSMNKHAGFLQGLNVKDARNKMIEALKEKDLLVKQKPIMHKTPICERSKDPIEFIAMKEFYVKQLEHKDKMKQLAKKLNFFAPESRQILLDWINTVSIDWPISRRRYYATEVPLWYCDNCNYIVVPKKGSYHQPWREPSPVKECPKCKSRSFRGETRVFDTWFDSSISPLYILKYSRDNDFFQRNVPCTLRPQGKEIIRTWLYYTVLKDYLLTKKLIFRDVWINYHIVDEKGNKMSKSKGNVIDPKNVLDKYGAEPFRLWAAVEGDLTKTDFRCSFERIEGAGKTLIKLWNVARFISMFPEKPKPKKLEPLDRWIMQEVNKLIVRARKSYEKYNFHSPAIELKHFLWETFASHYIELVKNRVYNSDKKFSKEEQQSALYTIHYCLDTMLKLLAPILPFITYKIYRAMREKDIHFENFPTPAVVKEVEFKTEKLMELDSQIWAFKKGKQLSLRAELSELVIPKEFSQIEKDLIAAHSVKKISYRKKSAIKL